MISFHVLATTFSPPLKWWRNVVLGVLNFFSTTFSPLHFKWRNSPTFFTATTTPYGVWGGGGESAKPVLHLEIEVAKRGWPGFQQPLLRTTRARLVR